MVLTEEERKAKDKARRQTPAYKAQVKAHRQTDEYKAKAKAYKQTPAYKAKAKAYKQTNEVKAREKKNRATSKRKAVDKANRDRPENKAKAKEYRDRPENKLRKKLNRLKPKNMKKEKAHKQTPAYKAMEKAREASPKTKTKRKKRRQTPEGIAKEKARSAVTASIRLKVLLAYSKRHSNSNIPCCRCCGENSHIDFLAIDHVLGKKQMDSIPELVEIGYTSELKYKKLINWIIENNFPEGFQILCQNCNFAKGMKNNNNICPHETARKEEAFAMMEQQSSFEAGF